MTQTKKAPAAGDAFSGTPTRALAITLEPAHGAERRGKKFDDLIAAFASVRLAGRI